MNKSSRILCPILAAMLLFSACGQQGASSQVTESSKPAESSTSSAAETPKPGDDLKPVTIRIMDKHPNVDYYNYEDRDNFPSWKAMNEELSKRNMTLEYEKVVPEQYTTVVQTRMAAASDLPDLINISPLDDVTALNLGINGQLQDWKAAMDTYSRPDPLYPANVNGDPSLSLKQRFEMRDTFAQKLVTAPDGKMYWCPNAIPSEPTTLPDGSQTESLEVIGASLRIDWLHTLKLEMPKTVDEFLSDLHAFQDNDMNGNGQKDERYCFDPYSYGFFSGIAQWYGLPTGVCGIDPNTDSVTSAWYSKGVKPYFELLSKMVKEDLFDTSLLGATEEMFNTRIAENKVAGLRTYTDATWFNELVKDAPDAEYTVVAPIPAMEGVKPYLLTDASLLCFDKYGITKVASEETVAGIIHLYDFSCTELFGSLKGSGIENVDYHYVDDPNNPGRVRSEPMTEEIQKMTTKDKYLKNMGGCNTFLSGIARVEGGDPSIKLKGRPLEEQMALLSTDAVRRARLVRFEQMVIRPYVTSPFSSSTYSIATAEEQEVLNTYMTALQSYSDELCMNLILGNESLDNWDAHMKKLQDLGLDQIIQVNQARYERYQNN